MHPPLFLTILGYLDRAVGLYLPTFALVLKYTYGPDFANTGKSVYRAHQARVRSKMLTAGRESDYLEFNVKDGWAPLCKFLGKDVPTDTEGKPKPFPRVNDRGDFRQVLEPYFDALYRKMLWRIGVGVVSVGVLAVAWWAAGAKKVF
jgi:Sulfotransferase domain